MNGKQQHESLEDYVNRLRTSFLERIKGLEEDFRSQTERFHDHVVQNAVDFERTRSSDLDLSTRISGHIEATTVQVGQALEGFPNKDPHAHKEYHLEVMGHKEVNKKRLEEIITAVLKWAAIGAVGAIATACWLYFKFMVTQ